jgi:hypothetical protein
MTNLTIFKNPNAMTAAALPPSKMGTQIASGMGGYNRIATNTNGTFKRIVNGEQVGKAIRGEFNAIILAMLDKPSRSFYASDYDPEAKGSAPDCFSNLGDKPEASASDRQASNCASCPKNIDGSGKNGKGKACRFSRKVALFLDGDESGDVYQFNIPAKSLFGKNTGNTLPFEQYCRHLVSNQAAPDRVVTTVAYNLDAETMELTFTADRFIDLEELARVTEAQNNPATTRLISFDVVKTEAAAPADEPEEEPVKLVTKSSPKKPSFLDADDGEDDEEALPEPVKRASKKTTAAVDAPTGTLAAVVSDWADDEEEDD